jgi:hypothetical protein
MPKFSTASRERLATCVDDLQRVMVEAIKIMDFTVVEGHRGKAAQNIAFNKGLSQKQWPNGEHNSEPSRAVDITPYPIDWSDAEKNTQRMVLLAGIVLACAFHLGIKLRWGGDWNMNGDTRDEHFRDYGHFEVFP